VNMVIKKQIAFTLAEVLITLLIIGVVASLVIPALIQDSQNEELTVMFKKNYSAYSDAARRMMMDNGGNLAGLFANSFEMQNKFGEYINLTKKCAFNVDGCFYRGTTTWKNLYGDDGWIDHVSYTGSAVYCSTAVMNNGSIIMFRFLQADCEFDQGNIGPTKYLCGWINIDVNGFKGPNVMGKDLFRIWVAKTGIYPYGGFGDTNSNWNMYCNKNDSNSNSGGGCAAKVLKGEKVD
jgi:type II secretory pathway pseudopilin PulG